MTDLSIDISRVALKRRRTKIVATVGPASNSEETITRLIAAGVDVFRLNFSHGTHEAHGQAFARIRAAAARASKHIAILADMCGPKIRVGTFEGGGIQLTAGEEVTVTVRPVAGCAGLIPSEYPALARDTRRGDRILLDDGKLELCVGNIKGSEISCRVVQGGHLSDRKGMNLPGAAISSAALTEKDRVDAVFAAHLGVDFLALSFVRAASDVAELKALIREQGCNTPVIAKIEKPEALAQIARILEVADGVMVARGDLGVEMSAEEVPLIQQELVRLGSLSNRPVIVATQMLESMVEASRPTRAEVSDVAAAATGKTDAVMLSAETAAGKFPCEAVATMDRVLRLVEGYQWKHRQFGLPDSAGMSRPEVELGEALSRAVSLLSHDVSVRAIVVPTRTGKTARLVAGRRPAAPVLALADHEGLCRQLSLLWGVTPRLASQAALQNPAQLAREVVLEEQLATPGQHILLVWDSNAARGTIAPSVSILTV